jgi:hypothetical protein
MPSVSGFRGKQSVASRNASNVAAEQRLREFFEKLDAIVPITSLHEQAWETDLALQWCAAAETDEATRKVVPPVLSMPSGFGNATTPNTVGDDEEARRADRAARWKEAFDRGERALLIAGRAAWLALLLFLLGFVVGVRVGSSGKDRVEQAPLPSAELPQFEWARVAAARAQSRKYQEQGHD